MARSGGMLQRGRGFKSRARKLMALCMGGVLLLSGGQAAAEPWPEGMKHRNLEATFTAVEPAYTDAVATCDLTNGAAAAAASAVDSLTLSQKSLTATLVCTGGADSEINSVPHTLDNVCDPTKTTDNAKCTFAGSSAEGGEVKLNELLGTKRSVTWTKTNTNAERAKKETWTLQLEDGDIPLTDKTFLVGCQNTKNVSSGTKKACKVTVNVQARASSVADNNVVTCAYGQNSNDAPLKLEMTTEKNRLTLICGSAGSLKPTTYKTQYCDPQEDVKKCTEKKFEDILPTIAESWWTADTTTNSATLTIPATEFPEAEQQFRLQCVRNKTNSPASGAHGKTEKNPGAEGSDTSVCNVIVTVKSGSSASSAGQMVATVSGVAAFAGLLVGSL
ncbi:SAG-related sequence SRS15B [Toxoplasma gondii CAST]|uniref:SAG-related sequence SRS15B n=1 Tax=Toxoplasma gondii CAST TaxID=943122 RepID=A0A3R7Z1E6_TOXGO|nr:SAG-related sequence SRS15B [Toxoplasma gondii CAST]